MCAHSVADPAPLPSRVPLLHAAETELAAGTPVLVCGDPGSGRSTFGGQLLSARRSANRTVRRISGSPALSAFPFAALAALGLHVGSDAESHGDPLLAASISRLCAQLRATPHTLLIDDIAHLDDASAAVIAQLCRAEPPHEGATAPLELIVTAPPDASGLPGDLHRLLLGRSHRVRLDPLEADDARALLDDLTAHPHNSSTVTRLLHMSGGNAMHLRELVLDAEMHRALPVIDGFRTLRPGWHPVSDRIVTLITARLSVHPVPVREAVEIIAVLGEASWNVAAGIIDVSLLDRAVDAGLLAVTESMPGLDAAPYGPASAASGGVQIRLGSGLTAELVLASLGRSALRERVDRVRQATAREALTPNARLRVTQHLRRLGEQVALPELREDTERAATAGLSDIVITLTDDLPAYDRSAECGDDIASLLLLRSSALSDIGHPESALRALGPLITADLPQASLHAARIEFYVRDDARAAAARLAPLADIHPEAAAQLLLFAARGDDPVSIANLAECAAQGGLSAALRLGVLAEQVVEHVHQGDPVAGVELFAAHLRGPIWENAPVAVQGDFVRAMFHAIMGEGAALSTFDHHFLRIDWARLALDHAAYLTGQGMILLEAGTAGEAAELLSQALGLLATRDPLGMVGFVAAVDSAAAAMIGDLDRARTQYDRWASAPTSTGRFSRPEAERAALLTILALQGTSAARARFEHLVHRAERTRRDHLRMRLLHDAWRLRLVEPDDDHYGLAALTALAERVQGTLAGLLRHYGGAFAEVSGRTFDGPASPTVEELVAGHLATGRPLYAAEVAARGAELAHAGGDRARASRLLATFAHIVATLGDVTTPSLGRVRVQGTDLSEREHAVCVRAAAGMSNAEIASELFLSSRTVEGHLQRAYAKLGVTDRRQLIA
ncbi:helix-turn-helix domain-containing protein [Microbacterium esteraromaticum]|uniref:helix-turn-helix domain-containing protein n=1 Tax=Microbacterium esteraromaticum TaxID=57043 RepID=UPI0019D345E3|nr:helix-turn-helix transcriptional regulator [Microbacterium esteraromaticum]MBN7793995.1 hypothetical protein [Microbacterium esteraromaticum]